METKLAVDIRRTRGARTQQVFATKVGASMVTLRKWERGETVPDRFLHIEALEREGVDATLLRSAARTGLAGDGHENRSPQGSMA